MKIGIVTFHWATNYGAILQAYCLQEFLKEKGHDVEIINFKPRQYDFSWLRVLLNPVNWLSIRKILIQKKKERLLDVFRNQYLNLTRRYFLSSELACNANAYDVLISGSDQIFNPYFTTRGEENHPSSVYYLLFAPIKTKKFAYAASFGCIKYPHDAADLASQWINNFDAVYVREDTGLAILNQLGYDGTKGVVPDPTILYGQVFFENIGIVLNENKESYTCVYMLRREVIIDGDVRYIDEVHKPLSMQEWLTTISCSRSLITNSYHGMIIAILSHVPFVVVLEKGERSGMNDRFITLLKQLHLENRMVCTISDALNILQSGIDYTEVDENLIDFKKVGEQSLFEITSGQYTQFEE